MSARGPGWRRPREQALGLTRRLRANERRLRPWREREGIEAYRVYDADVPTYNVAVDRYGRFVRVEEGARPRKVSAGDAEQRLEHALRVIPEVLDVAPARVLLRSAGRGRGRPFDVGEGDLRYRVDLSAYADGGLPLDERGLRRWVRERAAGRDVLVLPAGTCTLSVAAAAGGARRTTSVEHSRRKLEWGQTNLSLNGLEGLRSRLRSVLPSREAERYDLIVRVVADDRPGIPEDLPRLLAPGGEIVIATRLKDFPVDELAGGEFEAQEITAEVTPPDFARRPRLRAWLLHRR